MLEITRDRFDACLFDLDGVVTKTALVHDEAWKRTFDAFLSRRAEAQHAPFRPFDADADYEMYVDGKPRYDGVRSFLEARGITLPHGDPSDPATKESICGLGNRKDELVRELLRTRGVEVYEDTVHVLRAVRAMGLRTAIVSSSANCAEVLEAAGLESSFDVRVDGKTLALERLDGKPAPDTYLNAAMKLGVEPARAVVFEDAVAGVEAGRAGGFGLVVGVDRKGEAEALRAHGANIALSDLTVLTPRSL